MLHALTHRKLAASIDEPQRLEDALTSTVVGTLVMVDAWEQLAEWLQVPPSSTEPSSNDCWFWPRLAGAVEPDVILRIGGTLVVVEAKYRSGRNDLAADPDEDRPVDQILRQYRAVSPPYDRRAAYPEPLERAVRECQVVQAFVVDSRRLRRATREHAESVRLLPSHATLHLITWQALYERLTVASLARRRWAQELRAYLELVGLAAFQGIRRSGLASGESRPLNMWTLGGFLQRGLSIPAAIGANCGATDLRSLKSWRPSEASIHPKVQNG